MRRRGFLWAVIVASATLGSGQAEAGLLALDASGAFGPASTLGGIAFGADTPYSFRAVFDPAEDRNPTPGDGAGYFRHAVHDHDRGVRDLRGHPQRRPERRAARPDLPPGHQRRGVGHLPRRPLLPRCLLRGRPSVHPHAPTPTTFQGYLTTLAGFPYVVPLAGGEGELVVNDIGDTPRTASLVAPRPRALVAGPRRAGRAGPRRRTEAALQGLKLIELQKVHDDRQAREIPVPRMSNGRPRWPPAPGIVRFTRIYADCGFRRRRTTARPAIPSPERVAEAGSGTASARMLTLSTPFYKESRPPGRPGPCGLAHRPQGEDKLPVNPGTCPKVLRDGRRRFYNVLEVLARESGVRAEAPKEAGRPPRPVLRPGVHADNGFGLGNSMLHPPTRGLARC